MTKKPATESAVVQGRAEYQEVFTTDARPPSRLEQADNLGINEAKSPLV